MAGAILALSGQLSSADRFSGLLRELGWQSTQFPNPISNLRDPLQALSNVLGDGEITVEELDNVLGALTALIDAIGDLENANPGDFDPSLVNAGFLTDFPSQLVQQLLAGYLDEHYPLAANLLGAAGIIRSRYIEAQGGRPDYLRRTIEWQAVAGFLLNPAHTLQDALGWGTPDFDFDQLYEYVIDLADALGVPVWLEQLDESMRTVLEAGVSVDDDSIRWALEFPLYGGGGSQPGVEAGIMIFVLPGSSSLMPGLGFLPYASGSFHDGIDITDDTNSASRRRSTWGAALRSCCVRDNLSK